MASNTPIQFKIKQRSLLNTLLLPAHGEQPSGFELFLIHGASLATALLWCGFALKEGWSYRWWQMLLVSLLLYDMVGGVLSNLTDSTTNWYKARSHGFNVMFLIIHFAQPLVARIFLGYGSWGLVAFLWLYALCSGVLILRLTYHPSQRVAAGFFVLIGWMIVLVFFKVPSPLAWFAPVFLFKLVYCFAVRHSSEI